MVELEGGLQGKLKHAVEVHMKAVVVKCSFPECDYKMEGLVHMAMPELDKHLQVGAPVGDGCDE